jgi:hypothetical protein
MSSSPSSHPAPKTETSRQAVSSDVAFAEIQPFLGKLTFPSDSRVIQSFHQHYAAYMEGCYMPCNPIAHLYERLLFSRGHDIIPPTPESICRPLYFRPNVDLSMVDKVQPSCIRIHVFTTSGSEKVHLDEVSSMVIEPSTEDCGVDTYDLTVVPFLKDLFEGHLRNLHYLKLSGFHVTDLRLQSLSNLSLEWLHLTFSSAPTLGLNHDIPLGFRKMHLKLEEDCVLDRIPCIPSSLEELSLHFSNLKTHECAVNLIACESLKKM